MQDDLPGAQAEEEQDLHNGPKVNHVELEDDQMNEEDMMEEEEQEIADPDDYEVDQNGVNENAEEVEEEVDQEMDQAQEQEEEEEDVQENDFLQQPD